MRSRVNERCPDCLMREVLCLCGDAPLLTCKTRVTLITHWRELMTTSNSGRTARLALARCETRVRGRRGEPLETRDLLENSLLLFPSDDSRELTPEFIARLPRPVHLLVPDGTWRQARKVLLREPRLAQVPRVRLPESTPTRYRLRSSPHARNLSTLEAIARALGILEGPAIQEGLEKFFALQVERVLWSRGKLQMNEVTTGIPEAALEKFRQDGIVGGGKPC